MVVLGVCVSDELKNFFSKHGNVVEHEIIRDHTTKRSRGFGFVVFDSDKAVDNLLADGNMIDMDGTQVSLVHLFRVFKIETGNATAEHRLVGIGFDVQRCCEIIDNNNNSNNNNICGFLLLSINVMSHFASVIASV